jgi:hypothetical protein
MRSNFMYDLILRTPLQIIDAVLLRELLFAIARKRLPGLRHFDQCVSILGTFRARGKQPALGSMLVIFHGFLHPLPGSVDSVLSRTIELLQFDGHFAPTFGQVQKHLPLIVVGGRIGKPLALANAAQAFFGIVQVGERLIEEAHQRVSEHDVFSAPYNW